MLDPNNPLATYAGTPKVRVLSADGHRVVAWAGTLPKSDDGSKRQEAAVCTAFGRLGLQKADFDQTMTSQEFEHVMAGNGPPRYDYHTGRYHDYGAESDTDPNTGQLTGIVICTDDSLLVAKRTRP